MTALSRWLVLAAIAAAVWLALDLILLIFTGILLAIVLRTLAGWAAAGLRIPRGAALLLVIVLILAAGALVGILYAPTIAQQTDELTEQVPKVVEGLASRLRQYSWGRQLVGELSASAPDGSEMVQRASRAAGRILHGLTGVAVVLFVGLYLAAEPRPYVRGVLRLFPPARRRRIAEVLYAGHRVLRFWIFGQAVAMAIVGAAMGIGLTLIGVRLAFILGVLAGLFEFMPVVGPVLGLAPALLLSSAEGGRQVLYVLGLYAAVQSAESYIVTPLVQRRAVELPPVVTIVAQLSLGWMAGPLGLLVAVPLVAVVLVVVRMLYINDVLRDRIDPDLEAEASADADAAMPELRGVVPRGKGE